MTGLSPAEVHALAAGALFRHRDQGVDLLTCIQEAIRAAERLLLRQVGDELALLEAQGGIEDDPE